MPPVGRKLANGLGDPSSVYVSALPNGTTFVGESERQDFIQISSAIVAGDDLGPFVRRAFASGRPESLLSVLRTFSRGKEAEIEELCRAHFADFIRAVDDLRSLLSDVDSLKSSLSDTNQILQSSSSPLLSSLDSYLDARSLATNLSSALSSAHRCAKLLSLCSRANSHLGDDHLFLALRAVDSIVSDLSSDPSFPLPTLHNMLTHTIPAVRSYAEKKILKEFADWMVQIRVSSRHLGQVAIARASAARQLDEGLRSKQRVAEEHSDVTYTLDLDGDSDDIAAATAAATDGSVAAGFDLTPLYRAHHIHQTLGLAERFKRYYLENRKLQLTSDFQVSTMTPFLESHQTFFSQLAGFFIVEDRILRTGGGLVSRADVDSLWDAAVFRTVSVLEDQFSRMQTANHLLLIKDYVALFSATMRRYGYAVEPLLDILSKFKDKYHDLLLADSRRKVTDALAADRFDQMLMRKEYEYNMNVLAFQIQSSDIIPAFPYIAPFSSAVPDLCRIARGFIEDSISFLAYGGSGGGGTDAAYPAVKKYLERLLGEVVDSTIVRLVESGSLGVSQAMQVAANMAVMERACTFLFRHAAILSGLPLRVAERSGRRDFPLKVSREAAEAVLLKLLCAKVDDFMLLTTSVAWMPEDPPANGNEYSNEVIIYLETVVSTAQQILPLCVLHHVLQGVLTHISDKLVGLFLSDSVKRFNANAVTGINTDLKQFESFVENISQMFPGNEQPAIGTDLKSSMVEVRQLVNLLMSKNPENYLNPVIREKMYNKLDYKKVGSILEKFKDSSERRFGTFGTLGSKTGTRKNLDNLLKRLKDAT